MIEAEKGFESEPKSALPWSRIKVQVCEQRCHKQAVVNFTAALVVEEPFEGRPWTLVTRNC